METCFTRKHYTHIQWWTKWLEYWYFQQLKMVLSQLFLSFAVVLVGNIRLHFQTFILPWIVIIQWYFCLTTASAPHRDLIWSSSVCLERHEETQQTETDSIQKNWEEQRLQDASRNLPAKLPEKLCAPRAKAALNANDAHNKCWFNLVNRS